MRHLASVILACTLLAPAAAAAQPFAQPPDGQEPVVAGPAPAPYEPYDRPYVRDDYGYAPRSTVRIHTGPTLRISDRAPAGGLFAAVDIGEKAAGIRFSGAWVKVGGDDGLSQYGGDLWLDFIHTGPVHPILGAGAAAARVEMTDATGARSASTVGVGTLRATLQYALPIRDTDARASIDAIGAVPAIRGSNGPELSPYMLVLATVGVGF